MFRSPGTHALARLSGVVILCLHVLVVALAPHADARLDAASRAQPSHVEAPNQQVCAPSHNHLYCQLCRAFTLSGAGSGAYRLTLSGSEESRLALATPSLVPAGAQHSPSQPRAPPLS